MERRSIFLFASEVEEPGTNLVPRLRRQNVVAIYRLAGTTLDGAYLVNAHDSACTYATMAFHHCVNLADDLLDVCFASIHRGPRVANNNGDESVRLDNFQTLLVYHDEDAAQPPAGITVDCIVDTTKAKDAAASAARRKVTFCEEK